MLTPESVSCIRQSKRRRNLLAFGAMMTVVACIGGTVTNATGRLGCSGYWYLCRRSLRRNLSYQLLPTNDGDKRGPARRYAYEMGPYRLSAGSAIRCDRSGSGGAGKEMAPARRRRTCDGTSLRPVRPRQARRTQQRTGRNRRLLMSLPAGWEGTFLTDEGYAASSQNTAFYSYWHKLEGCGETDGANWNPMCQGGTGGFLGGTKGVPAPWYNAYSPISGLYIAGFTKELYGAQDLGFEVQKNTP